MSANTLVDVHWGLRFVKSPRWTDQELLFLDVHDRCVKSASLNGAIQSVGNLPFLPGNFEVLADGRMIISDAWHRKVYSWDTAGPKLISDLSDIARFCLSDGMVDSRGGLYVGDVGFDHMDPFVDPVPNGSIIYVSADRYSTVVARNLFFPNGMTITPDNGTLIVAEMLGHRLTAFEIENDGSLRNRRVWAQFRDNIKPEGICLNCEGDIWAAGSGPRALLVREGGKIEQQITTNLPVFATAFGGPDRKHLFLCTSASHDPVITRQVTSAAIEIAEVGTPGRGIP